MEHHIKTLEQQMAVYAAYHRHPLNRLTHFFGVPLIMFALFIPLSWIAVPVSGSPVTLAMIIAASLLVYYFLLDTALALAMTVLVSLLLSVAHWIADSASMTTVWAVFVACFAGGWILQIVGHIFEGRRPALVDNLWQIFVAPIFLMAEVFFGLGFKRAVRDRVRKLTAVRDTY
jgi:uncharacterized membrane protein YGL010W